MPASRPHISIPPGARAPENPSPSSRPYEPYAFEVVPPQQPRYDDSEYGLMATPVERPLSQYDLPDFTISNDREHGHGLSRPTTYSAQSSGHVAFPEPQLYRSVSQQGAGRSFGTAGNEMRRHRPSHSEAYVNTVNTPTSISRNESTASFLSADSFNDYDSISGDSYEEPAYSYDTHEPSVYDRSVDSLSQDLADVSLDSEEGLRRFQSHELAGPEEEWHRLVPEAAREALGNDEVQRQSVLFEIIKSERDYVSDLEAVRDVRSPLEFGM